MKKNVWLLGVAVAALTSCTQSEVVEVPESRLIGFDPFVGKSTRAAEVNGLNVDPSLTTAGLSKFYVFCEKGTLNDEVFTSDTQDGTYFNEVPVTISGGTYTTEHKSWQANKTFRFAAYSDGNNENPITPEFDGGDEGENWSLTFSNYVVDIDKDLVVAFPEAITTGGDLSRMTTVNLHFNHALSKVEFLFNTTIKAGHTMWIYPFGFSANTKGKCVCQNNGSIDWTGQSEEQIYTYVNGDLNNDAFGVTVTSPSGVHVSSNVSALGTPIKLNAGRNIFQCLVLPQSNEELVIPWLVVETRLADDVTVTDTKIYKDISLKLVNLDDTALPWEANTLYSYQANLGTSAHEIHFYAVVEDFDDPSIGDSGIMGN